MRFFSPIDTPLCIFSQAQTRFQVINILFVPKSISRSSNKLCSKTKNGEIFSELNYMEIHVWGKETETGGRKARGREGSRDVFPNKNQLPRA